MIEFPVTPEAFLSVAGVAVFGALVTQWLKRYAKSDLAINMVTLILCEVASILGILVLTQWKPAAYDVYSAALVGFVGATLAVFSYETIKNAIDLVRPKTD
jgi:hypothetical protein